MLKILKIVLPRWLYPRNLKETVLRKAAVSTGCHVYQNSFGLIIKLVLTIPEY